MSNKNWELIQKGKVRDIYADTDGEYIALVASDRVSAFDHILPVEIEDKGKVLTAMSAFWFKKLWEIWPGISTAFITADNKEMDPFFQKPEFEGRTTIMKRLKMLPVEAIVRGYITGSLWKDYQKGAREFCGLELPDGLQNCSELYPRPLFTPTTKAPAGQHDENISFAEMVSIFEKEEYEESSTLAIDIRHLSIELYKSALEYAKDHGIILADTKLEFGIDKDGLLCVGDELFTPDSSRFWPLDDYQAGREQQSMDKQIIRDFVKSHESLTEIPAEILEKTKAQYEKCLKMLTT